jgi:hypothetical protein
MSRRNAILWLRISYRVGAIADAGFALAMVYPPLRQMLLFIPRMDVTVETRSALGMGAAWMFGWTVLLLWANAKPIERRGVLVITVCPVIAGLAVTTLYGVFAGYVPIASAAAIWIFQVSLVSLFLFSYFRASNVVQSTP